jgi:hypothetical protein
VTRFIRMSMCSRRHESSCKRCPGVPTHVAPFEKFLGRTRSGSRERAAVSPSAASVTRWRVVVRGPF